MTYLFIGSEDAGGAILDALLKYREVKRSKPLVITVKSETGGEKNIEETLKNTKQVDLAFLFAELGDGDVTPRLAEILAGNKLKTLLVGILPASRREQREKEINAYQSMEKLREHVNSFLIVDNQRIAHLPNFEDYYPSYHTYIASCIADILMGIAPPDSPPESSMQLFLPRDEMIKALSLEDEPGYVALSRASELTKGLWGYIFPFLKHQPLDLRTLLRVSLEKFSVSDASMGCEKNVSLLQVPDYYLQNRSVDREQIEEFLLAHSKECHLAVSITKRNRAAVTNLFTYKFDQLERLRAIRRRANEGL
jgi:hypothetical protein